MMSRRALLRAAALIAMALLLYALLLRPRHYSGVVQYVDIVQRTAAGSIVTKLWYDANAHSMRVFVPTTGLTIFARCPGHERCAIAQEPYWPTDVWSSDAVTWQTLLSSFLPALPTPHPAPTMTVIGGVRQPAYALSVANAPSVEQVFWLDSATGAIQRYAELIAGHLVSTETFDRSVIPHDVLPAGFFNPTGGGGDPLNGLRSWLGNAHLP